MYQVEGSGFGAKPTELLKERDGDKRDTAPPSVHETSIVEDDPMKADGKAGGAPCRYLLS